jgi:hypothetical protein
MGRVVHWNSGVSLEGVQVSLVRQGIGQRDSVTTHTDKLGFFQLSLKSDADSVRTFDVVVRPLGAPGYRIIRQTANARTSRGVQDLGLITDQPFLAARFLNSRRCSTVRGIQQAGAAIVRPLSGPSLGRFVQGQPGLALTFDATGTYRIPRDSIGVDTVETLVAAAYGTFGSVRMAAGFQLDPVYHFVTQPFDPAPDVVLAFAPESMFVGCVVRRGGFNAPAGVTVDFTKTGGAATLRSAATTTTDTSGMFLLDLGPLSHGDVTGNLTVHGFEASTTYVARGVTIPASDSFTADSALGIGLHLPYFGSVFNRNGPAAGVSVTFRRTGGIPATPDSITQVTDASGRFQTTLFAVKQAGELVIDIEVVSSSPATRFTVKGLRLQTVDAASLGIHLIDFDLEHPPNGPP